jgi:hypothetical protein
MAKTTVDTDNRAAAQTGPMAKLLTQYGCGPVQFSGTDEALYERHLFFDSVTDINVAEARDRFEAIARSMRDVLSQGGYGQSRPTSAKIPTPRRLPLGSDYSENGSIGNATR